ncbi:MAG: hypothetical protein P4L84_19525 [Isosphaeraceae bacterium]|nr:hypothetical protein [Isosphaeraceae bacterium]
MPKLYSVRFTIGETLAEYEVSRAALTRFQAGVQNAQPGFSLPRGTQPHHLEQAVEELEGTYLIRMWAVFEAAWVSFWRHRTGYAGTIKAMHLIQWAEGVQEGHKAADDVTDDVNRVRLYRNFLVHGDHPAPRVPIGDAKMYLNRHLVKLPDQWPGVDDDD